MPLKGFLAGGCLFTPPATEHVRADAQFLGNLCNRDARRPTQLNCFPLNSGEYSLRFDMTQLRAHYEP